ncbi:GNAT family N-acetyltransferase [Clostridium thermosuccinogenes]|nr:hypothetical protein [Pseudoclostridium thermosuccinogenes]
MSIRLETERLVIRKFEKEDWKQLHIYTSNPEGMIYIPDEECPEEEA